MATPHERSSAKNTTSQDTSREFVGILQEEGSVSAGVKMSQFLEIYVLGVVEPELAVNNVSPVFCLMRTYPVFYPYEDRSYYS